MNVNENDPTQWERETLTKTLLDLLNAGGPAEDVAKAIERLVDKKLAHLAGWEPSLEVRPSDQENGSPNAG